MNEWPKLASFPSTNGLLVLVIFLWGLTGLVALALAVFSDTRHVPQEWFAALEIFSGTTVVQYIGKRGTHTDLWRKGPQAASSTTSTTTTTTGSEPPES